MHFRRLACFLLGAWLGGSVFMTVVATQNFRSVDRLLAEPAPAARPHLTILGENARALLRHAVSEQNRYYFALWEWVQLALGAVLLLVLLLGSGGSKGAVGAALAMFSIVLVFRFFLTPQITDLGRAMDFQPAGLALEERSRFWDFHRAYSAMEIAKWCIGLLLLARFTITRRKSPAVPGDLDMVEKSYHRHINR
jgi:hypothetical protein